MKKILLLFSLLLTFALASGQGILPGVVASQTSGAVPTAEFTLTSTGDGTGVVTFRVTVSASTEITLTGNGNFYSDAGGTADESQSWTPTSGAERTRYIKVTSGTSTMTFTNSDNVIGWGGANDGWVFPTNGPSVGGSIEQFNTANLLTLGFQNGSGVGNTLSGSVSGFTALTYLFMGGACTFSGSINALTSLTRYRLSAGPTVTIDGDLANICNVVTLGIYQYNGRIATYTQGANWININQFFHNAPSYGLDVTEVDNILIDMSNSSPAIVAKTITIIGSNAAPSAAADAAIGVLEGNGCTVTTN